MNASPDSIRLPAATYRLQFNSQFTFRDAHRIVDYLSALGISDCYASSYLKAVPGSPHGYDVADPTRLNPELGSDDEYWAWIEALKARGMGQILDVVPNHMGIARSANPWWLDVLENGESSRYAKFFDIEWHPVKAELANRVLIPILGDQYGAVLERQELTLTYADGAFAVKYHDESLPIAPDTYGRILTHGLDHWLAREDESMDDASRDELRSVITSADHLPARTSRDSESIATRAREKEVMKRRLATLVERTPALLEFIRTTLAEFNGRRGHPRSFDLLDSLLNEQSYRLAHWRVASEEINYRRFFDVNQLAALRMEDPEVFDEVHRFVFELIGRGAATGLRVDHVDGLFAPEDYLRRLQRRAAEALAPSKADEAERSMFLIVEKILGPDEQLPRDWPVHGTTGYEFAFTVNSLFVDSRYERALDAIYSRFIRGTGPRPPFEELVYTCKKLIVHETMSGDIHSLGHQLYRFAERNRHFRDFTLYSLISSLKEVIACFPVYRTYITHTDAAAEHDRRYITRAVTCARQRAPAVAALVFDFLERLLLKETSVATPEDCDERARFIGKFQQITGPIAAKGIEDTALYIYNRLLSLNEVGSDPTHFGSSPAAVHQWMVHRRCHWPAALSATSTHDTKRGEDVRARLNVLSEIPDAWRAAVTRWRALNRRFKREIRGTLVPDANEEYLLYQTLVGAWPFDAGAEGEFLARLKRYMIKALREAKVHTGWLSPDEEYESGVLRFIDLIFDRRRPFFDAFLAFERQVAELGMYNSLAQLVIKLAAPGIPDFYQGTELWDLSLVDPDNRRPVDYELRRRHLEASARHDADLVPRLLGNRTDGRIKMFTMAQALKARRALGPVFEEGAYVPLATRGQSQQCLFAFARRHRDGVAIACVPRLIATLAKNSGTPPLGTTAWQDTAVELPAWFAGGPLCDVFTGATVEAANDSGVSSLDAATLFERFPVALLVPEGSVKWTTG